MKSIKDNDSSFVISSILLFSVKYCNSMLQSIYFTLLHHTKKSNNYKFNDKLYVCFVYDNNSNNTDVSSQY